MTRLDSAELSSAAAPSRRRRTYVIAAGAAAAVLAVTAVTALAASHSGSAARHHAAPPAAAATAAPCSGPAGAAYVSDSGWDGFSAIDTATCKVIQTYNVGDTPVANQPSDTNYSSTNEGLALHQGILYFANTGNSTVAIINSAKLDPSNYNPAEKLINVGLFPQDLAVTPNGAQVWVAETGPQTSASSPSAVSVISTTTDKVVARLKLAGDPSQVLFSPSGARAYVVTGRGVTVYSTSSRQQVAQIRLRSPRGAAVSPDGKFLYVTGTQDGVLDVISTVSDKVTETIKVGMLPWQVIVSASGATVYVANADSDSVSVISAASGQVTKTVTVPGDPDTLALTPNGQQLWVGDQALAQVSVLSTSTFATVGTINLGGSTPQSGDGFEPTGILLTATPTPGS